MQSPELQLLTVSTRGYSKVLNFPATKMTRKKKEQNKEINRLLTDLPLSQSVVSLTLCYTPHQQSRLIPPIPVLKSASTSEESLKAVHYNVKYLWTESLFSNGRVVLHNVSCQQPEAILVVVTRSVEDASIHKHFVSAFTICQVHLLSRK